MNIGLISDIHGNHIALEKVLSALKHKVELIFFLGDLVGYYPFVNECADLLDSHRIIGVLGNHDNVLLNCIEQGSAPGIEYNDAYGTALERARKSLSIKSLALLKSLPVQRRTSLESTRIAMFHGAPWAPLEERIYPDFANWSLFDSSLDDIILLGHTHYPMVKHWKGRLIVNPGSVGQPRNAAGVACYGELDLKSGKVTLHQVEYDADLIIRDALINNPDKPYLTEVLGR